MSIFLIFFQYAAGVHNVTFKNKIEIYIYIPMDEFFLFNKGMHLIKEPMFLTFLDALPSVTAVPGIS